MVTLVWTKRLIWAQTRHAERESACRSRHQNRINFRARLDLNLEVEGARCRRRMRWIKCEEASRSCTHSFLTKQAVPLRSSRMKPRLGRIIPARKALSPPLSCSEKRQKSKSSHARAFPPSGRRSSSGSRSLSADARSHVSRL